jgi:hypothetical protein
LVFRIFCASIVIAIAAVAHAQVAAPASLVDVPADFLDTVDPRQHDFLERIAPYYVRLPDGRCVSLFRELHIWHEENNEEPFPAIGDAIAFGYDIHTATDRPKPDRLFTAIDVPRTQRGGSKHMIAPGLRLEQRLHLNGPIRPGLFRGELVDAQGTSVSREFFVTDLPSAISPTGDVLRPVVLWSTGTVQDPDFGVTVPVYRYIDAISNRPTPEQLAFAAANNAADLVSFKVTQSIQQKKQKTGEMWSIRWVPVGPAEVTYRWTASPIELRLRAQPSKPAAQTADMPPASAPSRDRAIPAAAELLKLRDGRQFRGRLIESTPSDILFEVVIGRIVSQMRFAKHEVVNIEPLDEQPE